MTDIPPPPGPTGPNYGPQFGTQRPTEPPSHAGYPGQVPQPAAAGAPAPLDGPSGPQPPADLPSQPPPRASRRRTTALAAGVGALTLALIVWFVVSLAGNGDPTAAKDTTPTTRSSSGGPSTGSSGATTSPSASPSPRRTSTYSPTSGPDKPVMPVPSPASPSSLPMANVPPGAKTVRLEGYATEGKIDVSFGDDTHRSVQLPGENSPWAAELSVAQAMTSGYLSLSVRVPYSSGTRADVMCRILVDGVVVTQQQSQGYANCYISPKYDIRRT